MLSPSPISLVNPCQINLLKYPFRQTVRNVSLWSLHQIQTSLFDFKVSPQTHSIQLMQSNVHYWDLQLASHAPIRLDSTLSLNDSILVLSLGLFPLSLGMPSTLPSLYSEPHCLPRPLPSLKTVLWVYTDLFLMWPLGYLPSVLQAWLWFCVRLLGP